MKKANKERLAQLEAKNEIETKKSKLVTHEQKKQSLTITENKQHNLLKASLELIKTAAEKLVSAFKLNSMSDLSVASGLMEVA